MSVDSQTFRNVLARWASGVTVVTTINDDAIYGMTASSFASVSLDPPLVLVCIGKELTAHEYIVESGVFAINILMSKQFEWAKLFARMAPYKDITDRFADIPYTTAETGSPLLPDVMGWVDCRVYAAYDGGDHTIFVGEVLAGADNPTGSSLLYFNRQWGTFVPVTPGGLTHVVMIKLHDPSSDNLDAIHDGLLGLVGVVPQIRKLEVGANVVPSDRAYDLALTVHFDSLADMEAYQVHPEHVRVLNEVIKPRAASVFAVDYTTP